MRKAMESPHDADTVEGALSAYLRDIRRYPLLEPDEEARLARDIGRGDREALGRLVEGNLRFVVSFSKNYRNQGLPYTDLIGAGNVGLMAAAERYDGTRGVRFISYAVWWIRQAILHALAEHGHIVRIPAGKARLLGRVAQCREALGQKLGRDPTAAEIAGAMEVSPREVEQMLAVGTSHLSLDAPTVPGGDDSLIESFPDALAPRPDGSLLEEARAASLAAALATLDKRAETVVRRSYGLGGGEPQTLQQIAAELGVSKERVRQIRQRALARLRRAPEAGALGPR